MNLMAIALSAGTLVVMAIVMTYILGWANEAFYVEVDPRIGAINNELPGANCGGCGFVGCGDYAEAIVLANAPVNKCIVGGESCAAAVADIMGVKVEATLPFRPIVHCRAVYGDRLGRSAYRGEPTCKAANLIADVQGCVFGCLGFGDCSRACKYDAIHVLDGLSTIDYEKCIGCGACSKVCPRNIITITSFKANGMFAVTCSNKDAGKDVTRVCNVGCIACKSCTRQCNLFSVVGNLSTIDYDKYDPNHLEDIIKAAQKCPRHEIVYIRMGKLPEDEAELAQIVTPDFKTTVDDTEWRG